jgi:CPA1 family monovalent cation:H+ antiporter
VVSALERIGHIPPVGRRNEAVLIWGGLRGGVALALALALPESLPERDMFVAMTGGVVLATLLLKRRRSARSSTGLGSTNPAARSLPRGGRAARGRARGA